MFLLRSAFWLTVAFVAIRPGIDVDAAARAMSAKAADVGQQIITEQILAAECIDLQCRLGKVTQAVLAASTPSAGSPMQEPVKGPVPFPRPRPDWMG